MGAPWFGLKMRCTRRRPVAIQRFISSSFSKHNTYSVLYYFKLQVSVLKPINSFHVSDYIIPEGMWGIGVVVIIFYVFLERS